MAGEIESYLLKRAESGQPFSSVDVSQEMGWDHNEVVGMIKSLTADEYLVIEQKSTSRYVLTEEAEEYADNGSPEYVLMKHIEANGGSISAEEAKQYSVGFGACMKLKWVKKEGDGFALSVDLSSIDDEVGNDLVKLRNANGALDALSDQKIKNLNRRKLLRMEKFTYYMTSKGPSWALKREKLATSITKEMLETGAWKTTHFKPVNFHSTGLNVVGGYLHPLLMVRMEFRKILIGMGFEEMPTNKWVENSFWNFDALFQPQAHPARDSHDTFFIKTPEYASLESIPPDYVETVKNTHEMGGYGSIGYRSPWLLNEAKKNILRTHTTSISSRMLYLLANQEGGFKPKKYFSIDRVFRNETIDATHLAEFHQVEGLVADRNLSLGDLIGVIKTFFEEIGITDVRFKPAYNPYTEPSMEIFGFHPDLNKLVEIGNSGMFRPEMLRPMGLPEDVRVIAWGLSLERPTMIKYRIKKIKELFGHKINLERTRTSPLPRFK